MIISGTIIDESLNQWGNSIFMKYLLIKYLFITKVKVVTLWWRSLTVPPLKQGIMVNVTVKTETDCMPPSMRL